MRKGVPWMTSSDPLLGISPDEYGEHYRDHVLTIYRTYLEMADRISARRDRANSFFLTINTAIVGFIGYLSTHSPVRSAHDTRLLVAIAGIVICYLWYRIIKSYRGLNSAKFKIVHQIESLLPMKPYYAEWESVGRGENKKLYLPITHIEMFVPWIFMLLHALAIVLA